MAVLLKTVSVWVSSIQIMQVRVQNKGKSVWKSRYVGDILVGGAPAPWAPPCLVGPLELHRPQLQLHIFVFGEKKIREKDSSRFTIRSRRQTLISLGRLVWSPFGAPERGICRHRYHQPSSITNFMMLTAVRE